MHRIAVTAIALALGATGVWAQNLQAIKQRQDTMQTVAKASAANYNMMIGKAPLDVATVQAGLKTFQEVMPKFKDMFPDNAKGGDSEATPKIWAERAAFNAAIEKFVADSKTAAAGITDEASLKKLYPAVAAGCGGCHKEKDGFAPKLSDSFKRVKW